MGNQIINEARFGKDVKAYNFVNIYDCDVGAGSQIASFVEIQRGVKIGKNCKIEAFAFIPTGVTIEDNVFVGPHVCFTNDLKPRATNPDGTKKGVSDWVCTPTIVKKGASIGAGAVIRCGITVGEGAMVGAGSVVTKDVPARTLVVGNPAKALRKLEKNE